MDNTERLKEIKRSFRLYMNGVTSQSMREKGAEYHINWGVSLQHLQEMATEYGKDYELATMLWKEDIRECRILATMIMPAEEFKSDIAMLWIEQIPTLEVAQFLASNLLQHVDYASDLAFQLMAEPAVLPQVCGYNIITKLFGRGARLTDRDINEFTDQASSAMQSDSLPLRKAANNALLRFSELGELEEKICESLLQTM